VIAVGDEVLVATAQIAATLIGLLLVGVLFFAETGLRQLRQFGPQAAAYLRSGTRFILLLYSLALALSLALLVLEPAWVTVTFVVLGIAILVALVSFTLRARDLQRVMARMHVASLWIAWPPVLVTLALPWAAEGLNPGREVFTATILLSGALAFVGTASLVLVAFDLTALEKEAATGHASAARDGAAGDASEDVPGSDPAGGRG
jgi:hypothetical protein